MAVFSYKGFDCSAMSSIALQSGTISADSPRQARDLLRLRGLTVEQMSEVRTAAPRRLGGRRRDKQRVTAFARELSTLLAVGTPLTEALAIIASQHGGSFRSTILLLREQVARGAGLAAAMAEQGAVFDELCINLIEVGEDTGTLELALERLAQFRERQEQLRGKLGTALLYPCMVLITSLAVSIFLMTYVVPNILQPLLEQGRPLPLPTQIVKTISDFLLNWGWLVGIVGLGLGALWVALITKTQKGRWLWDSLLLQIPVIGPLMTKAAVVRMAVVMETLLGSGVEFVRAIQIARKSTSNVVLKDALRQCEIATSAGRDIAPALQGASAFPPLVVQVFSVGQESGRLEEMLSRLAKDYDEQVAMAAQRFTSLLEPVLILFLAVVVATIALATMLPVLEAGDVLG